MHSGRLHYLVKLAVVGAVYKPYLSTNATIPHQTNTDRMASIVVPTKVIKHVSLKLEHTEDKFQAML